MSPCPSDKVVQKQFQLKEMAAGGEWGWGARTPATRGGGNWPVVGMRDPRVLIIIYPKVWPHFSLIQHWKSCKAGM